MILGVVTILAVIFIVGPLAIILVNSFNSVPYSVFPPPGLSLRWYGNLLAQSSFAVAAARSVILALLATALALCIGTMAAYALVRYRLPFGNALKSFLLTPIVMPKIVLGVAVFMFFVRIGVVENRSSLLLTHVLVTFPFVVVLISAALAQFDWSLEEAAQDLGAGPLRIFLRVILPEIRTSMTVAAIFAFITSFDQVETTLFLVRPGANTLPIEMFLYLQKWQDPTIAALSVVLILFAAVLLAILGLTLRNRSQAMVLLRGNKEFVP
jgi:putative spermidine/putrescine transport system permease protein